MRFPLPSWTSQALACLCGLLLCRGLWADSPAYALRSWGTDEGLPHNSANSLVQTVDGFLWIGTPGGVVRFDGVEFTPVKSPYFNDAKAASIRSVIKNGPQSLLFVNSKSELFSSQAGRVEKDPVSNLIRPGLSVQALFAETDNVFWILFTDQSVWRCTAKGIEAFPPPPNAGQWNAVSFARASDGSAYLARGRILDRYADGKLNRLTDLPASPLVIAPCRTGGIWVAATGALLKVTGEQVVAVAAADTLPSAVAPRTLFEAGDGALWIGLTNYGLLRWTPRKATVIESLHTQINALIEDREGDIWAATEGEGINRIQPAGFELVANAPNSPADSASSVCEDSVGDIWLAGHTVLQRRHAGIWEALDEGRGWSSRADWVCPDSAGNVWIARTRSLARARAGDDTPAVKINLPLISNIRAIFAGRDNSVWVGCDTGPLLRVQDGAVRTYGEGDGFTGSKAQAIAEDSLGQIWVGTGAGELFLLAGQRFTKVLGAPRLHGSEIRAIHVDGDGWVWVGTDGDGLWVGHGGQFTKIGAAEGLPDLVISQILEDDFGSLWFGSRRGLFKIARKDLIDCVGSRRATVTAITFGKDDGIPGLSAVGGHQPVAWKTRSDELWFATRKGFVFTNPAIHAAGHRPLGVDLERVVADGHELGSGKARAASSVRRFEFRYTSPAFYAPESTRFRYRLDGFDTDWSEPTIQRSAVYSRLAPGQYVFRVQAANSDLNWPATDASFGLVIVPVWYESLWGRVVEVLLAAGLFAAAVRYWSQRRLRYRLERLEQDQRIAAERSRIARDLHDGLGAGLAQVGMMAEEIAEDCDDLVEVRRQSSKLVGRVQSVALDLDAAVWAVSPKNDLLPALCAYLCEYALEYFRNGPIRCHVHTEENIPALAISPEARHNVFMVAKEAMANALRHSEADQVELSMRFAQGRIEIIICDNGRGFAPARAEGSSRNGLRNMRSRINEAGGVLDLTSGSTGTTVAILIPCPSP